MYTCIPTRSVPCVSSSYSSLLLLPIKYLFCHPARCHTVPPSPTLQATSTPQHPSIQPNNPAIATTCYYCYLQAIAIATTIPNNPQQISPLITGSSSIYMTTSTIDTVSPYPNINHTTTATMKKSPLTPSTITPPSINRQHSYNSTSTATTRPSLSPFSLRSASTDARNILSQVASRAASPRRSTATPSGSPLNTPAPESPTSTMERRRSWEDCVHQRDGYISFPDFDEINADASGR